MLSFIFPGLWDFPVGEGGGVTWSRQLWVLVGTVIRWMGREQSRGGEHPAEVTWVLELEEPRRLCSSGEMTAATGRKSDDSIVHCGDTGNEETYAGPSSQPPATWSPNRLLGRPCTRGERTSPEVHVHLGLPATQSRPGVSPMSGAPQRPPEARARPEGPGRAVCSPVCREPGELWAAAGHWVLGVSQAVLL